MSGEETKVQKICHCLSILTNEINVVDPCDANRNHKNIKEAFTHELKRNIHLTFQKIDNYPDIKSLVAEYLQFCLGENCLNCDYLKFLQLCLVLLRLLRNALLSESKLSTKKNNPSKLLPKGILSISQKKTLQKCLQFAVALGILPNLLRGIGIPLSKRLKHAVILEQFVSNSTLYQKHIQIAVCLDTLIGCLECETMQSTILTYHGTDILAALLQLCHAPIKKLDESEASSTESVETDKMSFKLLLCSFHDCSNVSQGQIINLMLAHRKYFLPHFELFLKQICPSLLMWELLLFQGIPIKNDESDNVPSKSPLWLRKICNQMLTDRILQNQGVANLVQVVVDKAYDFDLDIGKVDTLKVEAVARLITYNPVKHISASEYIQRLSKQIFHLLTKNYTQMDMLLKFVASCMVVQFCERDLKSAEQYLLVKLLKPLWNCVRQPDNLQENVVVSEKELKWCIEMLYEIFFTTQTPTARKFHVLLVPYSHCLSTLYFFLSRGKNYIKYQVKSLACVAIGTQDALPLLRALAFPGRPWEGGHMTKVDFIYGSEGGPVAVQKGATNHGTFPDSDRYHAILEILSTIGDKNLNRSFIMLVLKEFCAFHLASDPSTGKVFNALLQELSEWNVDIGEALMSDISEVINILMTLLESICSCKTNAAFYEKTLWVVLMILNSILESDEKLSAADWSCMQRCLPSLRQLQQCPMDGDLKDIIFSITVHIATRGASCKGPAGRAAEGAPKKKRDSPNNKTEKGGAPAVVEGTYAAALRDIKNPLVHIRGHGLVVLANLLKEKDRETLKHRNKLAEVLEETLCDDDSYVFLPSVRCLSYLADYDPQMVLPPLLRKYLESEDRATVLKLGEVLAKVCDTLGDAVHVYKEQLLHTYLVGTKREDPQIRSSSLSNLGQVCMNLKFNIGGHWLQEILVCVYSFLKTDPDLEVRRCAVMVIFLLLKGVGQDMITVLESELRDIYCELLELVRGREADEVLQLHAQLALQEVDVAVRGLLTQKTGAPVKEIRVLR